MHSLLRILCLALLSQVLLSAAETKPVTDAGGVWRAKAPNEWKVQVDGGTTTVSSPDGRANVVVYAEERRPITLDQ
jgi:hypothetical protein